MAREFGINAGALGGWANGIGIASAQKERQAASGPGQARIQKLEQENDELREKLIPLRRRPPLLTTSLIVGRRSPGMSP